MGWGRAGNVAGGQIVEGCVLSHEDFIFRLQGPREWLTSCLCHIAKAPADSLLEATLRTWFPSPARPAQAPALLASQGAHEQKAKAWGRVPAAPACSFL